MLALIHGRRSSLRPRSDVDRCRCQFYDGFVSVVSKRFVALVTGPLEMGSFSSPGGPVACSVIVDKSKFRSMASSVPRQALGAVRDSVSLPALGHLRDDVGWRGFPVWLLGRYHRLWISLETRRRRCGYRLGSARRCCAAGASSGSPKIRLC